MVVKMVVPDSPNAGEKGGKERAVGSGSRSIGDDDDDAIVAALRDALRPRSALLCFRELRCVRRKTRAPEVLSEEAEAAESFPCRWRQRESMREKEKKRKWKVPINHMQAAFSKSKLKKS